MQYENLKLTNDNNSFYPNELFLHIENKVKEMKPIHADAGYRVYDILHSDRGQYV